jgi:hypothetical protein
MWSQVIKLVSVSKGALVVGVAASAAMVSSAEFSTTPSRNEVPDATPVSAVAPVARPVATPESPKDGSSRVTAAAPQHGVVPDVFKECVERYLAIRELGDNAPLADREAVGGVCKAALAESGLSPADFWAKFGPPTQVTAPKTDAPKPAGLEALVKECVAQRQAGTADQSDACRKAISVSGLTPPQFWTKFGPTAEKAKHDLSPEVQRLVQECVTKYNARAVDATVTCKKAIELTGLTSAEFAATFHLGSTADAKPSSTTKPTAKPENTAKPVTGNTELSQLVANCLHLYAAVSGTTGGDTKAASEACGVAIRASGLTSAAFWAKYHPATN